jgi:putative ABC transport system permease protein
MKIFRVACRIAWRELRASPSRFLFVVVAVAIGVGALSGVKGFGSAFGSMLFRNAKQLTASDLTAQVWSMPTADQWNQLQEMGARVGAFTWVTETVSMAARPGSAPQMISVKAIDPSRYPFYGHLTTAPNLPLGRLLAGDGVLVNNELLIRLRLQDGDKIRIGGRDFRIAGTLVVEPDRLASGFGPSMRVIMSRKSLDGTGLLQLGSRAAQRFLFKLNPGVNLDKLKSQLETVLARPRLTDFRDGDPAVERGIDRSTTFLSLVSLIALIIGSLGVGMAMYSHLQQRMDTIAVMKAVGARSRQIALIYLIQTLWLGLAGGVLGVAIGALVQKSFPILMHQVFALLPQVGWDWSFSLQGLALGVLATLLFTFPPLVGVWRIRPATVFRREMDNTSGKARWRSLPYLASVGAIGIGFVGIALWVSGSWRVSAYFACGVVGSLILLSFLAAGLLRLTRWIVARSGRKLPANVRHGLANLYRPGMHASAVLVALGIGVLFIVTTYLIQRAVIRDVRADAPSRGGNVFLIDISPSQQETLRKFVSVQPGVEKPPEMIGYFVARMLKKNGTPAEKLALSKQRRDQLQTSRLSIVDTLPKDFELTAGRFWKPNSKTPEVAISDEEEQRYHIKLGDRLLFQAAGRLVETPVVAIYHPNKQAAFRFEILYPSGAMTNIPATYFGTVQVTPEQIPQLEAELFDKFPTITVMNLADILQRIQEAVDQIALVVRFLAAFAIFAGIVILSSSIIGTRTRRIREVAILKTLGATRRKITTIFSVEFTILGGVAGLMGSLLANGFSLFIVTRYMKIPFHYDALAVLVSVVAMIVLANIAGWAASVRLLGLRPLEVLRAE